MTEIRIERKRRPWWLLVPILLIIVGVAAWFYYNETMRPSRASEPLTIGAAAPAPVELIAVTQLTAHS